MRIDTELVTLRDPGGPPRSEGLHLSSVIRLIAVENGALDRKWVDHTELVDIATPGWWESLDSDAQVRMAIGMAWEDWYVRTQLPEVTHQPGELFLEGVYMTPDGESLETILTHQSEALGLVLHEVKTTSKSLNNFDIWSQYLWLTQVKSYCKAMGTLSAVMHVLFLYGDYSRPFSQVCRRYRLTFTQLELDDNWDVVQSFIRHKRQQQAENLMRDTEQA